MYIYIYNIIGVEKFLARVLSVLSRLFCDHLTSRRKKKEETQSPDQVSPGFFDSHNKNLNEKNFLQQFV